MAELTDAVIEEVWAKVEAARQARQPEHYEVARYLTKRAIELEQAGECDKAQWIWKMRMRVMN